jgi:hypothetical protein
MNDGNHNVMSHVLMTSPSASLYAPSGDHDTTETDSMIELMLRTMSDQMKELGERMQGMERHAHDMDKRLSADLSGINKSLEYLHAKAAASDARLDAVDAKLGNMNVGMAVVDAKVETLSATTKELGTRVTGVEQQLNVLDKHVCVLPTWKSLGVVAAATGTATGGLVGWLGQGGAKALARWLG